ncbi:MAG: ComF family protein, partial [Desulfococcaceae bacterium]
MKVNIMRLPGDWSEGFVLDWHVAHSEFLGYNSFGHPEFNTVRTEVGEALFQLKYRSDLTQIEPLAKKMADTIRDYFPTVAYIVPMPPTKERKNQPLMLLAKKVSEFLEIPFFDNILLKRGTTPPMKDIEDKEEKIKILMEYLQISDGITNKGKWDILIIDDLYSTGASLSAATRTIGTYEKANNIYV